ncbi:MAG: hypothetical protein JKY20_08125 [Alphaproteobacteria bacterium]|nr:hypothetical protein [Alphaproteobacteria bacterium]
MEPWALAFTIAAAVAATGAGLFTKCRLRALESKRLYFKRFEAQAKAVLADPDCSEEVRAVANFISEIYADPKYARLMRKALLHPNDRPLKGTLESLPADLALKAGYMTLYYAFSLSYPGYDGWKIRRYILCNEKDDPHIAAYTDVINAVPRLQAMWR